MLRDARTWVVALAVLALGLAALIGRDVLSARAQPAPPRLATVGKGTVTAVVSGTGTVVPQKQVNLNFRVAGQLAAIDVRVGDRVASGQVLARLDPRSLSVALDQAHASLQSAQAGLQAALTPLTPEQLAQLQHNVAAAQQAGADTAASVTTINQQDAATVTADEQQLALDQAQFTADGCPTTAPSASPAGKKCADDQHLLDQDQAHLTSDRNKQQQDLAGGQSRINQAQAAVTAAQDGLVVQSQAKPNAVQAARAQVASAQAQVAAAQLNVDSTVLAAPISGVILGINGQVGEAVAGGASTTPQAPGSTSPQPASSTTSGASAFIVLGDVTGLQVVAPFAEADAARLQADQEASITFDAIPNLTLSGKVVAVASGATVISNVVNYYATLVLSQADPRLRPGMTANAAVTVTRVTGVLTVPNAAVRRQGQGAVVMVYTDGRSVLTPVEIGMAGDLTSEVRSGLKEGDRVVLPTLRTPVAGQAGGFRSGGGLLGPGGGSR